LLKAESEKSLEFLSKSLKLKTCSAYCCSGGDERADELENCQELI